MHPESTTPPRPRVSRWVTVAAIAGLVIGAGFLGHGAIQRFVTMGMHAKTAEGPALLEEIQRAQLVHFERHGVYVGIGATPERAPGTSPTPFFSEHMDGWRRLGWQPESPVRCQYEVTVPRPDTFEAVARCDADGDGNLAVFTSGPNRAPQRASPIDSH